MMELVKEYAAKKLDLLKMDATERGVVAAGTLTNIILMTVFGVFFLIILNIGISFLIGQYLNNIAYGFLIVAGFYLILFGLVLAFGKKIKDMIANKILKSLNNPKHE